MTQSAPVHFAGWLVGIDWLPATDVLENHDVLGNMLDLMGFPNVLRMLGGCKHLKQSQGATSHVSMSALDYREVEGGMMPDSK